MKLLACALVVLGVLATVAVTVAMIFAWLAYRFIRGAVRR